VSSDEAATLSQRRLNRALLARQLLLERSELPLPKVLEQVGGLQTQYAPSGYIGLWTRMADFERSALTRALEERRAVQATIMRATIHTVSAADYWPLTAAIRRTRREWYERVSRRGMADVDVEKVVLAGREVLTEGQLPMAELVASLAARGIPADQARGLGMWLDLVRVPPSGTWERRRADIYGLADTWLPERQRPVGEADGVRLLVRRYLGAFGPQTVPNIAKWAGLDAATIRPALDRLRLRRYRDDQGLELLDLPAAPLPPEDIPAPVRFLPTWDATLLVHARATQILPDQYRPRVFNTRTPHSMPTFLVDGQVAGAWRYDKGKVRIEPFAPLRTDVRRQVEDEADRLAAFHAD
jgi:hypothetical protein